MSPHRERCSILVILAMFITSFVSYDLEADEAKADEKLLTRYFRVPPSLLTDGEVRGDGESWFSTAMNLDGVEDNEVTRESKVRKIFEASGVAFPPGAAAVYFPDFLILGVKNTPDNMRKIAGFMKEVSVIGQTPMLCIEARIMEYLPEVENELAGRSTFDDLEARLGNSVRTVCASSVITKSGQRAEGRLDSGKAAPSSPPKTSSALKKAAEDNDKWPPPAGVERALLEVAPTFLPMEVGGYECADMQIRFQYAAPQKSGQPAIRTEVTTNLEIKDGCLLVAKTFTISDPVNKSPNARRYAVIVGFRKMTAEGKTTQQMREEIQKLIKKPGQQ